MGAYVDRLYLDLGVLVAILADSTKVDMIVPSSFLHDRCLKIIIADNAADISSSGGDIVADKNALMRFSKQDIAASAIQFVNRLPALTVEGKTVKEWLRYNNTSLWWFIHPVIYPKIEDCIRFVEQFESMLGELHPEQVEVRGFYDKVDLIEQICKKSGTRLTIPLSSKMQITFHRLKTKIRKIRLDRIASQKEAKRIALARQMGRSLSDVSEGCIILVGPNAYRRTLYDFKNGKDINGEFITRGALEEVKKKSSVLCIDVDYTLKGDMEAFRQRMLDKDQSWVPLETFITDEIKSKYEKPIKDVLNTARALLKSAEFHESFNYNGVNLLQTMRPDFDMLLANVHIPTYILSIEAARVLLAKLKPRSLFLPYETGPYAKAFIVAATELGIKSVGIQHGIMHERYADYAHRDLNGQNLGSPIPSVLLVFGGFAKQILTKKFSYPDERVVIVGHPEYDFDPSLLEADTADLREELGLDPSKKLVVVATTKLQKKYGYEDFDVLMVNSLAEKLGKRSDIQLVLKPHPTEDTTAYESIIAKHAASNFIIRKNPIQQLVLTCDVFMTTMSTTAIEALLLAKPAIVAQIPYNPLSFTLDGGAIGAKLEGFPDVALRVLEDKSLVEQLGRKRAEFVKYHFNFPAIGTNKKIADMLLGN
jgi:CDP-glycerol glycerophosphotransferase (TagB/SpsB family)